MIRPLTPKEFVILNRGFLIRMMPFWLLVVMAVRYDDVVKVVNPIFLLPILVILTIVQLLFIRAYARGKGKIQ